MKCKKISIKRDLVFILISFILIVFSCSKFIGYDSGGKIAESDYLTFTSQEDGSSVSFKWVSGSNVKYKKNYDSWTDYTKGTKITLNNGESIKFQGNDIKSSYDSHFEITGKVSTSGCVDSLRIDNDSKFQDLAESCYKGLFKGCTGLTKAPNLPTTTLAQDCYYGMFEDCSNLQTAPNLPATILSQGCYYNMFRGCTSLKAAPDLPATKLDNYCYRAMFLGCTNLKTVPELPATNLVRDCYYAMFQDCTGLELSKTFSNDYHYEWKFKVQGGGDSKYDVMFEGLNLERLTPDKDGYLTLYSKNPIGGHDESSEESSSEESSSEESPSEESPIKVESPVNISDNKPKDSISGEKPSTDSFSKSSDYSASIETDSDYLFILFSSLGVSFVISFLFRRKKQRK